MVLHRFKSENLCCVCHNIYQFTRATSNCYILNFKTYSLPETLSHVFSCSGAGYVGIQSTASHKRTKRHLALQRPIPGPAATPHPLLVVPRRASNLPSKPSFNERCRKFWHRNQRGRQREHRRWELQSRMVCGSRFVGNPCQLHVFGLQRRGRHVLRARVHRSFR